MSEERPPGLGMDRRGARIRGRTRGKSRGKIRGKSRSAPLSAWIFGESGALCYDPLRERCKVQALRSSLGIPVSDSETSDENLMLRFAGGEAACFEELVRRYQGPMLGFIGRRIKPRARAEELLQEVFVRVVKSRKRYTVQSKFRTWLYTIARNICIDEMRRKSRRPVTVPNSSVRDTAVGRGDERPKGVETLPATGQSPESKAQGKEILVRIEGALDKLPEEQREVFVLRQLQGLSFAEVAEVLGISENTVKSRMRYALEKIRKSLVDLSPKDRSSKTGEGARAGRMESSASPSAAPIPGKVLAAPAHFSKEQLDG